MLNFTDAFRLHLEETIAPIAAEHGLATARIKNDLGEMTREDLWHRDGNAIIKPFVAIFRAQGAQLTAVTHPFMATVTATLEALADPKQVEDVKSILDTFAAENNGVVLRYADGDTSYTVSVSTSTSVVNQQARDVGFWEGTVVPVQTVLTFVIVEKGISSTECILTVDGHVLPFLWVRETHTVSSENTTTDADSALGRVSASMEMIGITAEIVLTDTDTGAYVQSLIENPTANRPHAVEFTKGGRTHLRLMTVGQIESTAETPKMMGVGLSFADASPDAADFAAVGSVWREITVNGEVVVPDVPRVCAVFWGDNTATKVTDGWAYHRYTDGQTTHTVKVMDYGGTSTQRWVMPTAGTVIDRTVTMRLGTVGDTPTAGMPSTLIGMDTGDGLYMRDGRLCMVASGVVIPIDKGDVDENGFAVYYMDSEPFEFIGRGRITEMALYAWTMARY